mgnify:CR=1 FL=1
MTPTIVLQIKQAATDPEAGAFDRYEINQVEVRELVNYINYLEQLNAQRHNFLLSARHTLARNAAPEPRTQETKRISSKVA